MAHYLVSARPLAGRMEQLESELSRRAFVGLEPFGRALSASLEEARRLHDGVVTWEEEDYCRPPLAQERAAVLDQYFGEITVELVERGKGWERIAALPRLFQRLADRNSSHR
jgi:hypothetical protein